MTIRNYLDEATSKALDSLEKEFFEKSALDTLKRYSEDFKNSDDFTRNYVDVVLARQHQRLGMYKEAHILITNLAPKVEIKGKTQVDKEVCLYFEWLLVAKKVFYKQYF